jgi:hypothetical protein
VFPDDKPPSPEEDHEIHEKGAIVPVPDISEQHTRSVTMHDGEQHSSTGVIVIVAWAIVGFIFWIPMLSRMIAIFTTSVLYFNLIGRDSTHIASGLEQAIIFYPNGFRLAAGQCGTQRNFVQAAPKFQR